MHSRAAFIRPTGTPGYGMKILRDQEIACIDQGFVVSLASNLCLDPFSLICDKPRPIPISRPFPWRLHVLRPVLAIRTTHPTTLDCWKFSGEVVAYSPDRHCG